MSHFISVSKLMHLQRYEGPQQLVKGVFGILYGDLTNKRFFKIARSMPHKRFHA